MLCNIFVTVAGDFILVTCTSTDHKAKKNKTSPGGLEPPTFSAFGAWH